MLLQVPSVGHWCDWTFALPKTSAPPNHSDTICLLLRVQSCTVTVGLELLGFGLVFQITVGLLRIEFVIRSGDGLALGLGQT